MSEDIAYITTRELSLVDMKELNDDILNLYDNGAEKIHYKFIPYVCDWLNDNGFDASYLNDKLLLDPKDKVEYERFIRTCIKVLEKRPVLTFYNATREEYARALRLLGIHGVERGNLHHAKFARFLAELMRSGRAETPDCNIPLHLLYNFFYNVKVPISVENDKVVEVLGVFPQYESIRKWLIELMKPATDIKIMFPADPDTKNKYLEKLIEDIGVENIQQADVPYSIWSKIYQTLVDTEDNLDKENPKDLDLFNKILEALHLDKAIPGLTLSQTWQLTNEGTLIAPRKREKVGVILEILNNLGLKPKLMQTKYGNEITFNAKKAYSVLNE